MAHKLVLLFQMRLLDRQTSPREVVVVSSLLNICRTRIENTPLCIFACSVLVDNAFSFATCKSDEIECYQTYQRLCVYTKISLSYFMTILLKQFDCVKQFLLKEESELPENEACRTVIKPYLFAHLDENVFARDTYSQVLVFICKLFELFSCFY